MARQDRFKSINWSAKSLPKNTHSEVGVGLAVAKEFSWGSSKIRDQSVGSNRIGKLKSAAKAPEILGEFFVAN
jgi:hypothetical protein